MTINSNNLDGIINLLNPKNDFYLIALLKDTGDGFTPEELSELKKKSTGELKPGAIHHYVLEGEIPKIDSTTLSAVKNRLNNLNHEKAVLMDFDRPDLIDKRDKEISFLSNYLSENLGLGCKIRSFPTSQSRLYNSVSKAIYRSIDKIREKHPDIAAGLKRGLRRTPKIRFIK